MNGQFLEIRQEICKEENPKDEMAAMGTEDKLREIRKGKHRNPREVICDMAAIEAKFKLKIGKEKKSVLFLEYDRASTQSAWLQQAITPVEAFLKLKTLHK